MLAKIGAEVARLQVRANRIAIRVMLAIAPLRRILNRHYLNLGDDECQRFHKRYGELFRSKPFQFLIRVPSSRWTGRFMNRDIVMPLYRESLWLHWGLATSINGVDIEVKKTYAELLSSGAPPEMFFDVGANYGTHSILFRSAGVPVVAFEPNPSCFTFCETVCQLNGFPVPQWEQVAIGDRTGQADLVHPEGFAWLGSISPAVVQKTADYFPGREFRNPEVRHAVRIRPLDDYIGDTVGKRLLIKIDVEGLELEVLRGASRILTDIRPDVIFESNDPTSRTQLYGLLASHGYDVFGLPWRRADSGSLRMTPETFLRSEATNFFARPSDAP